MKAHTGIGQLDDILDRLAAARSRDEHDDICAELAAIAPSHIQALDRLFDSGDYYRTTLIWCLIGQKTQEAVELFAKAMADKDQYTRWAAAEALSKCRSSRASTLLVAALKDRSHLVKGRAVDAMTKFRDPAAVPQLRKIIASKYLQRNAPGIVTSAQKALAACERVS